MKRTVIGLVLGASLLASGVASAQGSSYVGKHVGFSNVTVERELGSTAGYADRLRATAVARMAGAESAVVVKGRDGRWHALATAASLGFPKLVPASDDFSEIVSLPPLKDLPAAAAEWRQSTDKHTHWAALVLGLADTEVKVILKPEERVASATVNVRESLPLDEPGKHGPERRAPGDPKYFKLDAETAIEVRLDGQKSTAAAAATMFHEQVHRADYQLAQTWARRFYRSGDDLKASYPAFVKWIRAQKMPPADMAIVLDTVADANVASETHAYVRTALAALEAGATEVATSQLMTFASTYPLGPGMQTGRAIDDELRGEIEATRARLSPDGKKALDATFAAVRAKHPKAWIATLRFR